MLELTKFSRSLVVGLSGPVAGSCVKCTQIAMEAAALCALIFGKVAIDSSRAHLVVECCACTITVCL